MKIYFDMDGVLADFDRGVRELCHAEPSNLEKHTKEEDDVMWDHIRTVDHFYDRLEPVPGAIEFFLKVHGRYGDDCQILTGIPRAHRRIAHAAEDKKNWVARLISPDVIVNTVYRVGKKKYVSETENCILIDDYSKTVREWKALGGIAVHFVSVRETEQELEEMGLL